jgi:type IV secretion system protein VirD4
MKSNLNKLKREATPFFIAYLIFNLVIVGTLVVCLKDAQNLQGIDKIQNVFENYFKNVTNFRFLTAIFNDFMGFVNASFIDFMVFIVLFISWKIKFAKSYEYQGSEHGSSDWSKNGEEFDKLPDGSEILNKKSGFILSKKHYLGTDLRKVKVNKNILVVGGSGTGKSACYIKPNILQMLGSYVITDPKGELYRETSQFLKANGYKIRSLNLVDPEYSDRYNPLAHIRDHADVDIIAHTIVSGGKSEGGGSSDPFWDNTAKMLLKACIYYVISVLPEEQQNLSSCLNIARQGGADEKVFDKLFIDELKPEHPGRKEYENIRVGADKTKQSIAISLVSKLSDFDTPSMQKVTTSNNIDFEELGNQKTALFVITPADRSTYDYILTIFFSQLIQIMYTQADRNGGTLRNQVYFLMDEFANIGQIPDFHKKLSTTRSLGISMSIVVQSLDQIESLYKDTYENIIGNCDTHLFLGSQSIKTCEYFSKSLGQKTIKFQSRNVSKDKNEITKQGVSFSEQRQGRDLMTIDELKRLPSDEEIILVRGLKPIKTRKAWYYKYHPQKDNAKMYEIRNITEMPKVEEVEIKTMDVLEHIGKRERDARAKIKQSEDTDVVINNTTKEKQENNTSNQEEKFDLQKELEKKFDELFGTSDNH